MPEGVHPQFSEHAAELWPEHELHRQARVGALPLSDDRVSKVPTQGLRLPPQPQLPPTHPQAAAQPPPEDSRIHEPLERKCMPGSCQGIALSKKIRGNTRATI